MPTVKPPLKLYKYFPGDRADFLAGLQIRFTPPAAFNDPFDMAPVLDSVFAEPGAGGAFREVAQSLHKIGQRLADALANRHRFPQKFMSDRYGVLSLTAKSDTLLMWAHYASDHKGFAVEFATGHPWFDQETSSEDLGELGVLRKVRYSTDRPRIQMKGIGIDAFLTKGKDWSYEQEWRMVLPLGDARKVIPATPYPVHLFDVPADAMTAVIFGALMSEEDRRRVLASLDVPALKHVVAKQATLSSRHFLLEFLPVHRVPAPDAAARTGRGRRRGAE